MVDRETRSASEKHGKIVSLELHARGRCGDKLIERFQNLRECVVIVSPHDDEQRFLQLGGRDDGESGVASGSKFAHFDQWLVIELIDKRRAYLPLRNVEYLEEVSTST